MKKALSLILALTLCMALAVPAFAAVIETPKYVPEAPNYVKFDYTQYFDFSKEPLGWYKYPFGYWDYDANGNYVHMYKGDVLCLVVPDGTDIRMKQDYAFVGYLDVTAQNADFIGKDFEECDGMLFGWGDYPIFADQGFAELSSNPYYVFTDVRIYPRSLYENPQAKATDEESNFWFDSYLWEDSKEVAKLEIMTESFAKHYKAVPENSAPASDPTPTQPAAKPVVQPTSQNLTVNGEKKNTEIYNIDGNNFFKLRDMAMLLNGTSSQFSVDFDAASGTIAVKTGAAYTSVGGELTTGTDKSASAVLSEQKVTINGSAVELTAWNIGGNNFFKLRDLGEALNFNVDWDGDTATMLVTSR